MDTPDWSNKKVLIVEDEFIVRKYLEKILLQYNTQLSFAQNGEEAVQTIKEGKHFDLILMDLKMPRKNGFEATQEIKEINPNIPIIAQTALAFPEDEMRARAMGCDDFITKPVSQQLLVKKLIHFLGL